MSTTLELARITAHDVRTAILEVDAEPWRNAKSIFPAVWCEHASIAVAEVLAHRGLGVWTFVTAGEPTSLSGHAWLELREGGARQLSIDITLDQFQAWETHFIGDGPTPALARFTVPRYSGPWRDWPEITRNRTYAAYAAQIVAHLGGNR